MVDGKQYIAVQSGWGVDARGMQTRLNAASPGKFPDVPEGGGDLGVCGEVGSF